VNSRNITFSLPSELLREAKVFAAVHDTTVNALVRELLEEKLSRDQRLRTAAERLLAIAERGPYFSSDPGALRREDWHERR